MATKLGVGFVGAGYATQAVHLPTLATMAERWTVKSVMDVDGGLAQQVAERCGATGTDSLEEILEDPAIDVVAVCSPDRFHSAHVVAACRAGKRAILCEKPLGQTRDDVLAIEVAASETGTPVLIGTMHMYDSAYRAVRQAWSKADPRAKLVRSMLFLPPSGNFISLSTEVARPSSDPPSKPDTNAPDFESRMLRQAILGLAIHDIPLVREFYPRVGAVVSARCLQPFGYAIVMSDGDASAQMCAFMPGEWPHRWSFEALGPEQSLQIDFPPSFVMAGSARASLDRGGVRSVFEYSLNAYQSQWLHLHDVACGNAEPILPLSEAVKDFHFAEQLADRAVAKLEASQ